MWKLWWQANRASVPDAGPVSRVLTLDGYWLASGTPNLPLPQSVVR